MIRVGTILYGYCGGFFGRDSYADKRVEAIGADWVIAREIMTGQVVLATGSPDILLYELVKYTTEPEDDYGS